MWALLLAGAAACSASSDAPRVHFSLTHSDHDDFPSAPDLHFPAEMAAATGGRGWIDVCGFLPLPDHCDVVRARVEEAESRLTLRITARDDQGHAKPCGRVGRVDFGVYDARIEPVAPGAYQLRVVYDYGRVKRDPGNGAGSLFAERTALDVRVQVE